MNTNKGEIITRFAWLQTLINRHHKQLGYSTYNGQGRMLTLLKTNTKITQKELHSLFGMTRQSTAQLLNKLEKRGYIIREAAKDDHRISIIKLTEAGIAAANEIEIVPHERGSELDCLTDEELDIFNGYMERIIKRFEELNGINNSDKGGKI
jgi:DNA-binding MarR family transcriptional regulator